MSFFVARNGETIGEFTEADFREKVFKGEVQPEDHYWTDGMTDWQLVSAYRASAQTQRLTTAPAAKTPMASPIATTNLDAPARVKQKKTATDYSGFLLALLAILLPLVYAPLFFISLALLFATLILAIVSIVKGRLVNGILLLVLLPIATIGTFTCTLNRDEMLDPARRQALINSKNTDGDAEKQARFMAAVEKHRVIIGMTAEQCVEAWGKPESVNRTVTSSGKSEQWVYHNGAYLYLNNDILDSYQN